MGETAAPPRTGAPVPVARYAWLAIGASIATLLLKTAAWRLTGSVGLLSDAVESIVNLVAGVMALAMLTLAASPAGRPGPPFPRRLDLGACPLRGRGGLCDGLLPAPPHRRPVRRGEHRLDGR